MLKCPGDEARSSNRWCGAELANPPRGPTISCGARLKGIATTSRAVEHKALRHICICAHFAHRLASRCRGYARHTYLDRLCPASTDRPCPASTDRPCLDRPAQARVCQRRHSWPGFSLDSMQGSVDPVVASNRDWKPCLTQPCSLAGGCSDGRSSVLSGSVASRATCLSANGGIVHVWIACPSHSPLSMSLLIRQKQ